MFALRARSFPFLQFGLNVLVSTHVCRVCLSLVMRAPLRYCSHMEVDGTTFSHLLTDLTILKIDVESSTPSSLILTPVHLNVIFQANFDSYIYV